MADETTQLRIGDVAGIVTQMLADDRERTNLFAEIDRAVDCVFEPDPAIQELPYVRNRHFGMVDIADARNTGVRTFATLMPQIEIAPLNDEQAEYERTDMAEQAWMWEFERMNHIGRKSIHEQIMEDAMSYHAVAIQTEYLPYHFKRAPRDNRLKNIMRSRCFNWTRHHPGTVHTRESRFGLEAVAKVCPYSLQTLIDEFGRENPGVQKLLEKNPNAKLDELLRTQIVLVDYMDWKHRVQFATSNASAIADSDTVFMNEEHGLPFIPWVVVDKGDPIWKSILKSGMWDNAQYVELIRFAKSVETSTRSTLVIKSPDGNLQRIWMDYSNPSNPIIIPLDGTEISPLPPTPIDPQIENIFQEMKGTIGSSTVSTVLRDVSRFSNTPFSSVNQMVNMALGQLSRAKNTAGDAEAAGIYQGFEWISHSDIPFNAYRPKTADSKVEGEPYRGRGGQIIIDPGSAPSQEEIEQMSEARAALLERTVYYDLESLYIRVNLQSNNAADEQSRENVVINAIDKLNMSKKEAWERMGWTGYELNQAQRARELLEETELQKESQKILMELEQLKMQMEQQMQMQQMQMQQQAQQQQMQQQMTQQMSQQAAMADMSGASQPTLEGLDMRAGGNPAALANPSGTREQITGQSRSGEQIQR